MLKTIALVIGAAIAALLIYAQTRPDTFRVQRSISIKAPADKIHPLIAELPRFNAWNPFNKKDPAIKGSYRGPASGPGSAYDFDGNQDVGKGSLTILDVTPPSQVRMKLDMSAPLEAHNTVTFTLVPQGDATQVTWAMEGDSPFIGKLMGLVFNMDRMIGGTFEAGLADLKASAEAAR
ncbi:MAG: SRPBCC family protein [Burkholderiales bacterium]|nr:SRPBCC family protein [Burkholderiales bacterium]